MSDRKSILLGGLIGLALAGGSAIAQEAPPPLPPGVIGVPAGTGKWPAQAIVEASLPGHVVYRPAAMPKAKLPVVLWGNGGCRDNGLGNARFLRQVASHGYLIVAAGHARREEPMRQASPPSAAPVAAAGTPGAEGPARGADETQAAQLAEGLDWAIAQNDRRASPYYRRLDTRAVAVMGHSCGGLQAIAVAADPRIRTAMIFNSGIYNRGAASGRSGILLTKDALERIHGPVAYVNGGPADIAYANALDDYQRIDRVPALFAWLPVGHGGTFFTEPNGGPYADVAIAWLDWQLKGDRKAGRMFAGRDCGLCTDRKWTVARKGLDAAP
jgi:dienelactone hydrolase